MVISWFGQSFFTLDIKANRNLQKEKIVLAIDPFDQKLGLKVPKIEAQILLITHSHFDHNNRQAIKGNPFIIEEPGEYEVKGIFIKGIPSFHDELQGKERGENIIYKIEAEDLKICHLGDFGQKELTETQVEQIGELDILLIPVGGSYTIDSKRAANVVAQLEPKIVIPMHYKLPGLDLDIEGVEKFLKIMGQEEKKVQKKLKITLKDLPKEEMEILLLVP